MKRLPNVEVKQIDLQIFITTPKPQRLKTLERLKDYITISWNSDAQRTLRGKYHILFDIFG